jgi:hypothetical protein
MRQLKYCPYCGKEKRFDCHCEYGKLMKMGTEPNSRQKAFFEKNYCPKCGSRAQDLRCPDCSFSFSAEDFWNPRFW